MSCVCGDQLNLAALLFVIQDEFALTYTDWFSTNEVTLPSIRILSFPFGYNSFGATVLIQ